MADSKIISRSNAEVIISPQELDSVFEGIKTQSKAMQLFRRLPNMTSDQTKIKVLDALPMAYWLDETSDTNPHKDLSSIAWKNVTLYSQELAVIIPIKESTLADADIDIWAQVKPLIEERAGQMFDRAVFFGDKKPAQWPNGIITTLTGKAATIAGTTNFYSDLDKAFTAVETSGYEVTNIVSGLGNKSNFRNLTDTTGQPLNAGEIVDTPRTFVNNGSWDSTKAVSIVGDFKQAVYAIRQDASYKILTEATLVDPETKEVLYNLAQQDMVALRFTMRLGWAIPNPLNFANEGLEGYYPFAVITPKK